MSEENGFLSVDQLAAQTERRYKVIDLLTGGRVRIRSLTALEMRIFQNSFTKKNGETNTERAERIEVLMMANCLVDGDGNLQTSEADAMAGKFDSMDGAVTSQIYEACSRWTGFSQTSDFAALEDEVKNLRQISGVNSS